MLTSADGLAYLDVAEGVSRIGGNKSLFSRLLDTFVKDTNWDKLNAALAENNLADAANCAHAIKGMCANLSMKALSARAADLEAALKAGKTDDVLLAAVGEAREQTLVAVEAAKAELA